MISVIPYFSTEIRVLTNVPSVRPIPWTETSHENRYEFAIKSPRQPTKPFFFYYLLKNQFFETKIKKIKYQKVYFENRFLKML